MKIKDTCEKLANLLLVVISALMGRLEHEYLYMVQNHFASLNNGGSIDWKPKKAPMFLKMLKQPLAK